MGMRLLMFYEGKGKREGDVWADRKMEFMDRF